MGAPRLELMCPPRPAGRLERPGHSKGCQTSALARTAFQFPGGPATQHSKPFPSAHESLTTYGTHRVLRGPLGSGVGGPPLGLLTLLTHGTSGLAPRPLWRRPHGRFALQLSLALAVPRGAQLGFHGGQLVPQLRIHQQEALQLLLQRLGLLAALQQVTVVSSEFVSLAVGHLLELPQQSALFLWPRAQLYTEALVLLPQPPQLQFGLLRRYLQLGEARLSGSGPADPSGGEGSWP